MEEQTNKKVSRCQCLDFAEACLRHRIYPLMYCHMELKGSLDIPRLKRAVSLSGRIVPEILFACNFQKSCFVDLGYTAEDVVVVSTGEAESLLRPDLRKSPQLRIIVSAGEEGQQAVAVMSHILADGAGFLQYLYLLASIYNGEDWHKGVKNERKIAPLLKEIRVLSATEQTRYHSHIKVPPLRPQEKTSRLFCLNSRIRADDMAKVRRKAKRSGVTLNDVFMTAYGRVIARMTNADAVVLPCPADLRRFHPEMAPVTVANMTGMYRRVAVEIPPGCSFGTTLQQVHLEMLLQRSRRRCFAGIKALDRAFRRAPDILLRELVKAACRPRPVSYTNLGTIDGERLRFRGCALENCYFTGTYRHPPDFQLTISTFRDVCTLNCAFAGASGEGESGQRILDQVRQEILDWAESG